jgi:hypothetical protein
MTTTPNQFFHHEGQRDWNTKRLNKLYSILGKEWFTGKSVLEVGCGHGENGKSLMELGAHVTFTDGRPVHVNFLLQSGFDAYVMDQDQPWTIEGDYDLVLHWGVLYHTNDWRRDVKDALDRAPLVCLETEIWGSDDPNFEHKRDENCSLYDQALNGIGTIMSARCFEDYVTSLGVEFERYDDPSLDSGTMRYSWDAGTNGFIIGQRRFWMLRK